MSHVRWFPNWPLICFCFCFFVQSLLLAGKHLGGFPLFLPSPNRLRKHHVWIRSGKSSENHILVSPEERRCLWIDVASGTVHAASQFTSPMLLLGSGTGYHWRRSPTMTHCSGKFAWFSNLFDAHALKFFAASSIGGGDASETAWIADPPTCSCTEHFLTVASTSVIYVSDPSRCAAA
jgi:hypothetical protein